MIQSVNLYTEDMRPRRDSLTLNQITLTALLALAIVVLGSAYAGGKADNAIAARQVADARVVALRDNVASAAETLKTRTQDPQLQAELDRMSSTLRSRDDLITQVEQLAQQTAQGFSPLFLGLARQRVEGVWLTALEVDRNSGNLALEGLTTDGSLVPFYLERLRAEEAFAGQRFRHFKIGLIALTLIVAILLLGWRLQIAPGLEQARQARAQARSLQAESQTLSAQLAVLEAELALDPNQPLRQQRQRLQARLEELQTQLESLTGGLVSPEAMVVLLRQMLTRHKGLTLESVGHDPAQPVRGAQDKDGPVGLYSHGVSVTVSGRYFELVEYLRELEALDDRLGWSALKYDVEEWPRGRLQIRLKTLSLSEEWLGV